MSTIVTKYSDYQLNSIEFFIEKIIAELAYRDIKGLTNNKIEMVNVTKQHPIVALMAAQINQPAALDVLRSNLIPAISVTPGGSSDDGFTMGQGPTSGVVDADFIANLNTYAAMTDKDRLDYGIITTDQITNIETVYNAQTAGDVLYKCQEWRKSEEINISSWNLSPDLDIIFGNILDSLLAEIQVGFLGDKSPVVNFQYKTFKGLTNFNFGRVLFGTEYNLTFLNTYNNYTIYYEGRISEYSTNFTHTTPGED